MESFMIINKDNLIKESYCKLLDFGILGLDTINISGRNGDTPVTNDKVSILEKYEKNID